MQRSLTSVLLVTLLFAQSAMAAATKPNLIVILTDDQGYGDVGFNGSEDIRTPNMDRLAREGVRFTDGYVTYPVCGPSRAGLLTGRYQDRFGFGRNPSVNPDDVTAGLPNSERNIAEILKPAGYRTGVIGKWHMGTHPSFHPNKRGFDYFYGFLSGGHRYFPEELVLNDVAESRSAFDWYRTRIMQNQQRVDIDEYLTDEFSNEAVAFIEREKDEPFFLYLAYNAPHGPLQATDTYLDRYPDIEDDDRRTYAAMVSAVDDGIGRILEALERLGIDENTLIFFLSDNGGAQGKGSSNKPLRGFKSMPFEGGVRVPFAARWKGTLPNGVDFTQPVSSLDILATINARVQSPIDADKPLDGVDLLPYLTGKKKGSPHEVLFWKNYDNNWYAIRNGDDKYIHNYNGNFQFFNLKKDLSEKNNLVKRKRIAVKKNIGMISEWDEHNVAPIFPPLSSWSGNP
ncbi:MAG: sulfatase-like hydrolase/transferase [Gammaproteobacteria bacterium]|nr:sulfatase-like hydrolase/transferase [Gammaproteobacteria bacterium]MDH3430761.1 sulfatase-like hydrolase/transferase [Gammaproteobacteria bacterium]